MGRYCFAHWRLSSSVMLPVGGRAGRRARGWSAAAGPGAWVVRRPTLHGGPVWLRPVRATPCYMNHLNETSFYCLLHRCYEIVLLYGDSASKAIEKNSNISVIQTHWLPSVKACW